MKKTAGNTIKDLWMLSSNVAILGYILMVTFLFSVFNFDFEISGSIKALNVTIFFVLSLILAYSYKQEQKKFKVYDRIFKECLASGSFLVSGESEQACSSRKYWQKSLNKSKLRRFSYPTTSIESSSFHQKWKHVALNSCIQCNRRQLKPETGKASASESNRTSSKGCNEIPVILHNCVKDLDNVIERIKSINIAYMKNLKDVPITDQNLTVTSQEVNLDSQIAEKVKDLPIKITKPLKENSGISMNISSWPQAHHRDLGTKGKPIKSTKLVPANFLTNCLWKHLLQNIDTPNLPESVAKDFILKSILLDINESGNIFHRLSPDKRDYFSMESISSLLQAGKVIIHFYKTKAVDKDDVKLLVSFKKHVPKIPMRPYVRQISMTKNMQEMSRERYIYTLSIRKSSVNNKQTVSKVTRRSAKISPTIPVQGFKISVDEMLLAVKQSLIAVMCDSYASSNEILISKFDKSDLKNFAVQSSLSRIERLLLTLEKKVLKMSSDKESD